MINYRYWLIACVAFVILEILPPPTHFFFVCMAFGALGASIAALFSTLVWLPWVVFAVVSVALTPLMIPLAKFLFTPKPHASNADALIGQKAIVTAAIHPGAAGAVKVKGEVWRALCDTDDFEKGQFVEVVKIEGASVIVRRKA
jgi:membrane protein implicated in regulation of membrane protease activity